MNKSIPIIKTHGKLLKMNIRMLDGHHLWEFKRGWRAEQ
jgi:hypothetical protein|tara:strand:+ start:709 stop:825 length:117 start_codon:yes stop_codon:yes gene_type:complete